MEIIICDTPADVAGLAAGFVQNAILRKPRVVLGTATGSTPLALYDELAARNKAGKVSFAGVTAFNLDEFVGLPPEHSRSFRTYLDTHLFNRVDIDKSRTFLPNGMCSNPMEEGIAYEKLIRAAGGIDLQILGVGPNGHIGFNEPSSSLSSRTRVKTLTAASLAQNRTGFGRGEKPPEMAITMGIGTIMEARQILLLATGTGKADCIAATVEGPVSAFCPASALQYHNRVTVIIDHDASVKLKLADYYSRSRSLQKELETRFGERA